MNANSWLYWEVDALLSCLQICKKPGQPENDSIWKNVVESACVNYGQGTDGLNLWKRNQSQCKQKYKALKRKAEDWAMSRGDRNSGGGQKYN